jgi:hypothetical protein
MNQGIFSASQSKALYKTAGTTALLITLAGLIDALTSMGIEARANSTVNIIEWFTLFQTNRFAAFSSLGLINIITISLDIPIYVAFNLAHRKGRQGLTAFASILFFIGAAVYFSSNTVFSLFALSNQYAIASELQKPLLEAAGQALLAQGADLTSGTFIGLVLIQIAGLLITSLMLRGIVFGKWIGRAGLAGFSLMTIFFILTAFAPEHYTIAMAIALPGALTLMAYQIMLALRFFKLAR